MSELYPQFHVGDRPHQFGIRLSDVLCHATGAQSQRNAVPNRLVCRILSTQVLVIFIIRTRGNPFKSRAHPILVATSIAVVVIGATLPFTLLGTYFGFVSPPARFYAILAGMTAVYLAMVEFAKRGFYRWHRATNKILSGKDHI